MIEPIYDLDAEKYVLSSIFQEPSLLEKVNFLKEDDFYSRVNREIYKAMLLVSDEGNPIDIIFIEPHVKDFGVDIAYLSEVHLSATSYRNAIAYADIVKDVSTRRQSVAKIQEFLDQISDKRNKSSVLLANLSDDFGGMVSNMSSGNILKPQDMIDMSIDEMEKSNAGHVYGISTGIQEIDERLGDSFLAYGEITALGALSKNGKTLTANTITARAKYQPDETCHIFSIEMIGISMFNGIVSAMTGVPANFYRKQDFYGEVFKERYTEMSGKWGRAAQEINSSGRITIDDHKEVDADYICAGMKKQAAIARNNGQRLGLVVIDHLHRMNFHTGNQPLTYAIRDAVRKIKNTAAELGIAVLLLVQLNNKAEGQNPTSFHILDSASVRHEMQAFIGTRIFRQNGSTYFGIYGDSQRYADMHTRLDPAYMRLVNGVLTSLNEGEKFIPNQEQS